MEFAPFHYQTDRKKGFRNERIITGKRDMFVVTISHRSPNDNHNQSNSIRKAPWNLRGTSRFGDVHKDKYPTLFSKVL